MTWSAGEVSQYEIAHTVYIRTVHVSNEYIVHFRRLQVSRSLASSRRLPLLRELSIRPLSTVNHYKVHITDTVTILHN